MSGLDLDPPVCHGDHLLEAVSTILVEGSAGLGDVGDEGVVELGVQLLIHFGGFFEEVFFLSFRRRVLVTSTGGFPLSSFVPLLLLLLKVGEEGFMVGVEVPHKPSAVPIEGDQVPSAGFATCFSFFKLVEEEFKENILIGFGRGHVESSKAFKELMFK